MAKMDDRFYCLSFLMFAGLYMSGHPFVLTAKQIIAISEEENQ